MDESPTTITSLTVLGLLIIFIIVLTCHFFGPQAFSWVRSNKEEKIGLSKNKLFHANGYMMQSGSEFLLSTSGSFKRFDTIEPDVKNPAQYTSPLWNLPQTDHNIPPQPLRPAPASISCSSPCDTNGIKTVTFSKCLQTENLISNQNSLHESYLRSLKQTPIPRPLQAPPPPRLSTPSAVTLPTSAIPRPVAKRLAMNDKCVDDNDTSSSHHYKTTSENSGSPFDFIAKPKRNTNPFVSEQNLTEQVEPITATQNAKYTEAMLPNLTFNSNTNNGKGNPFYSDVLEKDSTKIPLETISFNRSPFVKEDISNNNNKYNNNNNNKFSQGECSTSITSAENSQSTPPIKSPLFRNRSFSETEASDSDLTNFSRKLSELSLKLSGTNNPFTTLAQKVKGPHMLQKTLSEDFLFHNKSGRKGAGGNNPTWNFGWSLLQQDSQSSNGRQTSSQFSLASTNGSMDSIHLGRAISTDSVNSESSFALADLEQPQSRITGQLCVDIQYDKNSISEEGMELNVTVIEAKDIVYPSNVESFDTFVRIYLIPDQFGAMQTKVINNTLSPIYNDTFGFWLRRLQSRHSLWFHLYHNGEAHTLLGEAEMEMGETPRPCTAWLPLSDSQKSNAEWGELMLSLSYLPTAERLTIVVVKARNLKLNVPNKASQPGEIKTIFIKVYLMNNDKKVLKKRTSHKRKDRCPIFNELVIFSLPPQILTTIQLRLTVFGVLDETTVIPMGHVIVGSCATGKGLRHWHQMLSSLRKPVAMWHCLRRAANQPIFKEGVEAALETMQSNAMNSKRNSIF